MRHAPSEFDTISFTYTVPGIKHAQSLGLLVPFAIGLSTQQAECVWQHLSCSSFMAGLWMGTFVMAAGVFYWLTKAGAVSALPAHLMSDHVFLGSSLVAMLSAEAVLVAKDVRYCYLVCC